MKNSILNLEGAVALTRKQMSTINGAEDLPCKIWVRGGAYGEGGGWSGNVSLEQAQSQWNGTLYSDGTIATGYCCASCPTN